MHIDPKRAATTHVDYTHNSTTHIDHERDVTTHIARKRDVTTHINHERDVVRRGPRLDSTLERDCAPLQDLDAGAAAPRRPHGVGARLGLQHHELRCGHG